MQVLDERQVAAWRDTVIVPRRPLMGALGSLRASVAFQARLARRYEREAKLAAREGRWDDAAHWEALAREARWAFRLFRRDWRALRLALLGKEVATW